jgi:hypothetical protein
MRPARISLASLTLAAAVALGGITGADVTGTHFFASAVAEAHAKGPAADLRVALNQLLSEHATLAAAATQAALRGRKMEFAAAAEALDANSIDIANAIGSVYGTEAGEAFLPLWRKHIGMFVDYTMGKAAGSKKKQDKAVADLLQYAEDFAAFLNSATPSLPKEAVAELVKMHIVSLKEVVDAQAARDYKLAFEKLRAASHHMQMVADPLADAISAQFPDKFAAK